MTHWQGKRLLITGSAGFIGSHLAERLVSEGAVTRCFVRYNSTGSRGWLDTSPLVAEMDVFAGDVRDGSRVRQAMQGVEVVLHLAAVGGIPYSYLAPDSYVQINTTGALNILQAAIDAGVERVVMTSTSEVYGTARYTPQDEAHPIQSQSPYSASKAAADKIAEAYHHSFGLPVTIVRPFNAFGIRQSARAIIPAIITQLLAGATVTLGNLDPVRDLTYVSDTVDGFVKAAECDAAVGRVFNLGTGRGITVGDLALLIARLMERTIIIEQDPVRMRPAGSEVERLVCDATLARTVLGWEPRVTLEEGLQRTIEWIAANQGRYRVHEYAV